MNVVVVIAIIVVVVVVVVVVAVAAVVVVVVSFKKGSKFSILMSSKERNISKCLLSMFLSFLYLRLLFNQWYIHTSRSN
jgi:hypothetical protein